MGRSLKKGNPPYHELHDVKMTVYFSLDSPPGGCFEVVSTSARSGRMLKIYVQSHSSYCF